MNARMRMTETSGTGKLSKLREAQAKERVTKFEAAEKTGFLSVGNGKAVHIATADQHHTLCGVEGIGSAQVRTQISNLRIVHGPATCKRCLNIKNTLLPS